MKLKKIKINKLFGVFDHEVLVKKSGITIIIGENGLGKTVLLEMIEAFFKPQYFYFSKISFDKMIFEFSDGVRWELTKEEKGMDFPQLYVVQINKNKKKYKPYQLISYEREDILMIASRISRHVPYLRRVGLRQWEDRRTGEIYRPHELMNRFSEYVPDDIRLNEEVKPKWFSERHNQFKVSLIETQRLISLEKREEKLHENTVEKYSKELSISIKSYLSESTELSSKLDRTYPNRLIDRIKSPTNVTDNRLNLELNNLEKKRELLDTVGLIEIEKESNLSKIEKPQDVVKEVLMLYIEDSFKKLEIFDRISRKIEILLDIINKRFKHKYLSIDKEEGFLFKSTIIQDDDGNFQKIPVMKLSSGEQNELVLFYLLLFKTESNSLILIDEPEVSLHISWQNCFIEDLKIISDLNNLDVIIATHSPDIISNNWDLKTELKGIE